MGIKSEASKLEEGIRSFPKLMQSIDTSDVVLFTKNEIGIVIVSFFHNVGYYSECWNMKRFTDYNGTVTLKNE
jgi:hypothetical protein